MVDPKISGVIISYNMGRELLLTIESFSLRCLLRGWPKNETMVSFATPSDDRG
jgi:hypothetical protein